MHHAGPANGGGFCPVNDLAVAIRAVQGEGFEGQIAILDLDAHPPDGTWGCLRNDPRVWIGSLSGCDWGPMAGVDETVLPERADDATYLAALEGLLKRMPEAELVYVVAGGDVLAGDKLGGLGLTLKGVRQRDLKVAEEIAGLPSVWLPAGGYSAASWQVLAGTALAVELRTAHPIRTDYDPLRARYDLVAGGMKPEDLGADSEFDDQDIAAALGLKSRGPRRLLDYYTTEGVEFALHRFGVLEQIGRLGYGAFRVTIEEVDLGDRLRLWGKAAGQEHLLVEAVLEKQRFEGSTFLYVHWLTLRHPRAHFDPDRPRLPGQEVPGLGMAREAGEMLNRIAQRLGLSGVAFRPAWFHMAYTGRYRFRFLDPARHARFEAMVRDLKRYPLLEVTNAVALHQVRMNGAPYTWEPEVMVYWLDEKHAPTAVPALPPGIFSIEAPQKASA